MYEALNNLIKIIVKTDYLPENIFDAFVNRNALPTHNNYIIITELNTTSQGYPQYYYDAILENENYNNLDDTMFQVDFYGQNSALNCRKFRIALQSAYATNYLFDNYGYSIKDVQDMQNLTLVLDQEEYVKRYMVRFGVFNNNYLVIDNPGYTSQEIDLYYAGNTKGTIINN